MIFLLEKQVKKADGKREYSRCLDPQIFYIDLVIFYMLALGQYVKRRQPNDSRKNFF